ncbi:hypothetical protein ACCQ10_09165 [Xanthomonas sp. NCPPB 1325]|uniref:hypothetical protein n=1 Tax=Xanthomonas sp. NCPPB 1325 TaxID=487529 RepID=UPI0035578317
MSDLNERLETAARVLSSSGWSDSAAAVRDAIALQGALSEEAEDNVCLRERVFRLEEQLQPDAGSGGDARAQFEAWAKNKEMSVVIYPGNVLYNHPVTRGAWMAWRHLAARQPVDTGFVGMLLSVINDVQEELGFTEDDKECGNGSAEIVGAIRELKEAARQPVGVEPAPVEIPQGAIVNGAAFADRLERDYQFECPAGPLVNCTDYIEFRRCFDYLAQWASSLPPLYTTPPAPAAVPERDQFTEGDLLYRIDTYCLIGGISDSDFRNNAAPLLEDLRAYLSGNGSYEIQPEIERDVDGDRYRWLRDVHIGDEPHYVNLARGPQDGLDSAIDAAMLAAHPQPAAAKEQDDA